jgi:hypothetical protein
MSLQVPVRPCTCVTYLDVLNRCPDEKVNRASMGAFVLFTSLIALLGALGHLTEMFACTWQSALPFAFLWGAGIFAIDLWLVGTLEVGNSVPEAFRRAWIRLCLALVFGAFAAEAVILQRYKPEIDSLLMSKQVMARQAAQKQLAERPLYHQIETKQQQITALEQELQERKTMRDAAEREMIREIEGLSATGRAGKGPAYAEKRTAFASAQSEYRMATEAANRRIEQLHSEISYIEKQRNQELAEMDRAERAGGGHAARLLALGELIRSNYMVAFGCILQWLILMAVDCLPILVKIGQAGQGKHAYDKLREEAQDAEIKHGTVAIRGMADKAAQRELHRQMLEREAEKRLQEHLVTAAEKQQKDLIDTVYLPAAKAHMEKQMRQHVAQMGQKVGNNP